MKLSFDWLSDYVDLSGLSPQEVADKLTMGAFEVEEVREFGPDIQGDVVVGQIVEIAPHPNADKIRVTQVKLADNDEPRQVVCGAWNIEVGHRIPVALPGSKVINRKDGTALNIMQSQIRGVTSNGMLCSPPELGVSGNGEGILILDEKTPLGTDVRQLLGITRDSVLIVGPRSNRGDALSVVGMAREVASLFNRQLRKPDWSLPEDLINHDPITVAIENENDCPFFTIRFISGLSNPQSPPWMVRRLEAVGMRTVSALVDITNYVMHELGQPLHAYDVRQINNRHIEVRRARAGEKLVTLDEKQRDLNEEVLAIADKKGVIGIAGVMGGKGSEIADDTVDVALEAASFNNARVRRSSRLLGLSSDSSLRFERTVDIGSVREASDRATYLMHTICGGKIGQISSAGSDKVKPLQVTLRMSEMKRLTEIEITPQEVNKLLSPLGFEIQTQQDAVIASVPSFRQGDVTREIDLVEEVTRLYGYDRIQPSMPKRTIAPPLPDTLHSTIRDALVACGLSEAWISSLISLTDINGKGSVQANEDEIVKVLNPLSEDHQVLRNSLLPGLLRAVAYNQDRGRQDVWLFEIGLTYKHDPQIPIDRSQTGTVETSHVGAIICGNPQLSSWNPDNTTLDKYYLAKGVLENVLQRAKIPRTSLSFESEHAIPRWYHPSRAAAVFVRASGRDKTAPTRLGYIGDLHPVVADAYGLREPACIFELNISAIRSVGRESAYREIYPTPVVMRDITADLDRTVSSEAVQQCIVQVGGKLLQQVDLVSVFNLSDQKKSLSYRMMFQDPEKTLTADEVEKVVGKVRQQLSRQLSATFRT